MRCASAGLLVLCAATAARPQQAVPSGVMEVARDGSLHLDGAPVTSAALRARLLALATTEPSTAPRAPLRVVADGDLPWVRALNSVLCACRDRSLEDQEWSVAGADTRVSWRLPIDGSARPEELRRRWIARVRLWGQVDGHVIAGLRWFLDGDPVDGLADPASPGTDIEGSVDEVVGALGDVPEVVLVPDEDLPYRAVHAAGLAIAARAKGRLLLAPLQ